MVLSAVHLMLSAVLPAALRLHGSGSHNLAWNIKCMQTMYACVSSLFSCRNTLEITEICSPPQKKKKKNFFFKFQKLRLKLKSVSKANTKPVLGSFQCHDAQTAVLGLGPLLNPGRVCKTVG